MSNEIKNITIKMPWTNRKSWTTAIISLTAGILIFSISYLVATNFSFINQSVLDFVLSIRQYDFTVYMRNLTIMGSVSTIGVLTISIAIIWASYKRELWRPILLVISILLTGISAFLFKSWYMIERPAAKFMIKPLESDYAFPSGHTIGVFVLVLIIGYLICSRRSSPMRVFYWLATTMIFTIVIAFTRLYLGYHWLTDTTAAVGLGLIILSVVILLDKIVTKKFTRLQ